MLPSQIERRYQCGDILERKESAGRRMYPRLSDLTLAALAFNWVAFILLGSASAASGERVAAPAGQAARVTHVVDGSTLEVLINKQRARVRLVDIEAPEQGRPYGLRSRQSLIQICLGEIALLESKGKDRNGRTVARVLCNGTDASAEQVKRGMAWVFDRNSTPDSVLHAVQDEARATRRGLWSESGAVRRWESRRQITSH